MRDLFEDAAPAPGRPSDATRLVDLALGAGLELVHDDQEAPYGSVLRDGHRETMALTAPAFSRWLRQLYFLDRRRVPWRPGPERRDDTTLTGIACFEGPQVQVATRLAVITAACSSISGTPPGEPWVTATAGDAG